MAASQKVDGPWLGIASSKSGNKDKRHNAGLGKTDCFNFRRSWPQSAVPSWSSQCEAWYAG